MGSDGDLIGDLATDLVPTAAPGDTAGVVRDQLSRTSYDHAGSVVVLDDGVVIGTVPLGRLLGSGSEAPMAELLDPDVLSVEAETRAEHAAHRAARGRAPLVCVTDGSAGFVGVVPAEALTEVLVAEHDEDLARLGGRRGGAEARRAVEESLSRRLTHRLPWLLVGLAGAMASAVLVGSFEEELRDVVLLSFFVPAVVYMADSVGTQTETLLIRAMAAGLRVRDIVGRELATGAALGIVVALLFFPFAAIGWGDTGVAVGVSLALLASCSIATTVAMVLPATFQRLGVDPAFGSGPLATVIQDLLSIAIYFAIAVPIAT
jgi:magnesium transporter